MMVKVLCHLFPIPEFSPSFGFLLLLSIFCLFGLVIVFESVVSGKCLTTTFSAKGITN